MLPQWVRRVTIAPLVVPLAGVVDIESERPRLEKAIEKGYGHLYSPAIYKLIEADE